MREVARTIDWLALARNPRNWMWGFPMSLAIIAIDQVSKQLVLAQPGLNALACRQGLAPCGKFELSPVVDIAMTWNRGVSFGVLQSDGAGRWLLFVMTGAIAAGFAVWLVKAVRPLTALSLAMVIGGAVGNLIDRAIYGAVVDFLDFSGFFFPWVFNIADACISGGAALLLVDQLLAGRKTAG
jgi:signal peptidase II